MAFLRRVLQDKGVQWIGLGWTAFTAENLILSENRSWIIQDYGDKNYHLVYNTLSTAATASIAYGYLRYGRGKGVEATWFRPRGLGLKILAVGLQTIGFVGAFQIAPKFQLPVEVGGTPTQQDTHHDGPVVPDAESRRSPRWDNTDSVNDRVTKDVSGRELDVHANDRQDKSDWRTRIQDTFNRLKAQGLQLRCPMDFKAADDTDPNGGVRRVTRHPLFWSLGFIGLGAAVATRYARRVVMFTMPAVFCVIGCSHQDSRYRRGMGGTLTPETERATSNLPFVALLEGRQSWSALYDELMRKDTNVYLGIFSALLLALLR